MSTSLELPIGVLEAEMMSLNCCLPASKSAHPHSPSSPGNMVGSPSLPTRCKECSQKQNCKPDVKTIMPMDLAKRLNNACGETSVKLLLLDCRPFIAYNLNHINGALNISCCDRFTKRKLERGKASVGDLVSGHQDAKSIFREFIKGSDIVLYDESTSDIHSLPSNNPLSLVLANLVKDGREVFILKGNFFCGFCVPWTLEAIHQWSA